MEREFTRKELYELVWSQPMRSIASDVGISDVALAKHCKRADIPVPPRGYWARKQAGKPVTRIPLPPRFPGASDRVGGSSPHDHYYGSDWPERFRDLPVPCLPTFDEELSSVEKRIPKLVGNVRCPRIFEPAHPLVAKLLSHDEERRREYAKWRISHYAPIYDSGIERRRLLIINALFVAAERIGCRPFMSTSKYSQNAGSERNLGITIGAMHTYFTIEPVKAKGGHRERLCLALGMARNRESAGKFWQDSDGEPLENQLTSVLVDMLVSAETIYRDSVVRFREWIIERKADAEAEFTRRREEAERKARELQEKLARERVGRLLTQAKAFDRANQIRDYVESASSRVAGLPIQKAEFDRWAEWALREADSIDPVKNGTLVRAVNERSYGE